MSLIKKYNDELSVIEIYDDSIVNAEEKEELLKEIYDLCNEIAREQCFTEEQIKEHFYSDEELETINKES